MVQIGLNDIATAGKIAWGIYQYGFSKARSAHAEYAAFGVDIREFADNLGSLREAIQRATDAGKLVPSFVRPQDWDLSSLNRVLGDFNTTLKDCKKIMDDRTKFKKDSSGFVHNIYWNLMLAEQVKNLRERVAFHSVKLLTIMKPLELKLYSDIWQAIFNLRSDVAGLREDIFQRFDRLEGILIQNVGRARDEASRPIREELPLVPDYMAWRFKDTLSAKFHDSFPIDAGVDALAYHFDRSTLKFQPRSHLATIPEPSQYLNLMKSIWILSQLKCNRQWARSMEVDSLWRIYLREMEMKMIFETKRFGSQPGDLQKPNEQDVLLLPHASFEIFTVPGSSTIRSSLLEARGLEEKIFQISLRSLSDSRKQELTIYRVKESRLRIITVTTSTIQGDREIEGPEVDLERIHLLPLYALPEASDDTLSLSWKANVSDIASNAVSFNTIHDLRKFQQAITNYQVLHDRSGLVQASCKKPGLFNGAKTLAKCGRVQIWLHKPLSAEPPETGSPHTSTTRTSGSRGRDFAASLNPSSAMIRAGAGSLMEDPRPPLLVLLTENIVDSDKVLGFVTLPLDIDTKIEPESCRCNKASAACDRVVIERKGGLHIKHYLFKGQRDQWNAAVLRSPNHVDASSNLELLKGQSYLALDFQDVSRRIAFAERFEEVKLLYRRRRESYNRDMRNIRNLDVAD